MTVEVAVVGPPFLDITFEGLPAVPAPGEEILARALHVGPGGTGMQAIGLARLGVRVALVAALGSGFGADELRRVFDREGVRLVGDSSAGSTPTTALFSTPSGVAMATVLGGDEPRAEQVRATKASAVVVSLGRMHLVPERAAVYAVTGGLEASHLSDSALDRLGRARAVIASAREAAVLTGHEDPERAAQALAGGATTALVTLGGDGVLAARSGETHRMDAPMVDAVDATGAGDLFAAAYVWADLRGVDLEARLGWATLYAALSVREPTALAGAVRLEELVEEGARRGLTPP